MNRPALNQPANTPTMNATSVHKRKWFPVLLGIFLCLSWAKSLFASHIIGGEIRYQCLGNNKYKIILDVYRDCYYGLANFDSPAHISIFTGAGTFYNNINISPLYTDTLPNVIAGDPCSAPPPDICVEHARYEKVITLLPQTGGYYIVYQRCCRNKTISNILMPDSTGATYYVYLSEQAMNLCNSSPEFGYSPPVFVCVNKPINHPTIATDLDGDSLVYSFYTPFKGASITAPQPPFASPPPYDTVVWRDPPFNLKNLVGGNPPLTIDKHTGLITGTPMINGQFVVGVMVEEYRNGVLLSRIRRDFQYNVGQCLELEATIEAPDAQCDNLTIKFGNNTPIADQWIWYFQWPDTTILSNEKTPTYTYPDTGNYTVALIAQPGSQCADTSFHDIFLQYNSLHADFALNHYDCDTSSVLALTDLSTDSVSPIVSWLWEIDLGDTIIKRTIKNPAILIPNPSSGTVTLTVTSKNGCEQTVSQSFTTGSNNPKNFLDDLDLCLGDTIGLNPTGPVTGFTYIWDPPISVFDRFNPNPLVSPDSTTTYTVTVKAFSNLCEVRDTLTVSVFPPPNLDFDFSLGCDARQVSFQNKSTQVFTGYFWDFGDPTTDADTSYAVNPSYEYAEYGTYEVRLMTDANAVCHDTITRIIDVAEKILEADFSFDYSSCEEDVVTIQFTDASENNLNNTSHWNWSFSGAYTGSSNEQHPEIKVIQEGTVLVTLSITTSEGCTDTSEVKELEIEFIKLPNIDDGTEVLGCLQTGVLLNPGGNPNYSYSWSPSDGLSCTDCPSPFANPSQTTTYTVVVTNQTTDECTLQKSVTVVVPPDVELNAGDDILTCEPTTILHAQTNGLASSLEWFANGFQIGNGPNLLVSVSGEQEFVVKATDDQQCPYFDTVHVAGGPVDLELSGDTAICTNEALSVFANNLDPNDEITWQWAPASLIIGATDVPNPVIAHVPGLHQLIVNTTNQFDCKRTDTLEIAIFEENAHFDFDSQVDCDGFTVQFENNSVSGFGYVWDFGVPSTSDDVSYETNPVFIYPDTGTYLVTLFTQYPAACLEPVTKEVQIVEPIFRADFTYEFHSCDTDSIEVHFYDGSVNFLNNALNYQWQTNQGQTSSMPNPLFTAFPGQPFEVTLQIESENGCRDEISKVIPISFIDLKLADTIVLCKGDSAFLNPLGDPSYQYHWSPSINLDDPSSYNPMVWPKQTITYSVEVTNISADTCTLTRSVTVLVPEEITLQITPDTFTCGNPIELFAVTNASEPQFTWLDLSSGSTLSDSPNVVVNPQEDHQYLSLVKDKYGCTKQDTVMVRNEAVTISLLDGGSTCPGDTISLVVLNEIPNHNLHYSWSSMPAGYVLTSDDVDTAIVLTPNAGESVTYEVEAINQFGCSATKTTTLVSYDFMPELDTFIQACVGDTIELNPLANPGFVYNWEPSSELITDPTSPNPLAVVQHPTSFQVTISNSFGAKTCAETFTVDVDVPEMIVLHTTPDTFTCGAPISISASANVAVEFSWFDDHGNLIGNGSSVSVNPDTTATFTVQATDEYGCFAFDSVQVSNYQLDLYLEGNGIVDTCPMPSYNLCITNLDPLDSLSFNWSVVTGGEILSGGDTNCPEVSTQMGATAIFEVEISNQWGCKQTETYTVETIVFDPVIREVMHICPGVPTELNPDAVGSPYQYHWEPQVGLSCYDCPNPTATLSTSQVYTVSISGYNPSDTCSFVQFVSVKVMPPIELSTTPADTVVICEPVSLDVEAHFNSMAVNEITWYSSTGESVGTGSQITLHVEGRESYYVVATDTLGCRDTATLMAYSYPIDVSFNRHTTFCEDKDTLHLIVTNHAPDQELTFDWWPPELILDQLPDGSVIVDVSEHTVFYVDIENQYGCSLYDSIDVEYVNMDAEIDAAISTDRDTLIFNSGQVAHLFVTYDPAYTYEWVPPTGLDDPTVHNPVASPEETQTYTVYIFHPAGCVASRSITIYVINPDCDEPNIFVPNAFTPNGDGYNDVLYVRSNIIDTMEFAIYNRWGQKVFETRDLQVGWDGTFKGEPLGTDVFGYYLKAKCFNGQEFFKKGNISLMR